MWRPLGARLAGLMLGVVLFVVCAVAWLTFAPEVKAAFNTGQRLTLLGMGALIAALLHALGRCRVEGRSDRLIVVNGYRRREYAWAQVLAVTLPPGAPGRPWTWRTAPASPRWASRAPTGSVRAPPSESCAPCWT
ncbi:MAG: hypothetical protein R2731_04160 [Nocardioides sp.]